MFPRGLCHDIRYNKTNSACSLGDNALIGTASVPIRALSPREHALLVLLYRIIDEKWAQSLEHQLLCQTVPFNVDIGNYVVLGLLCTLFKLIWEAIAGDTRLITPPPPEWVQTRGSNQQPSTLTGQAMVYPIVLHFDVVITQILTGWRDEHFFLYQAKSTQIDRTSGGR